MGFMDSFNSQREKSSKEYARSEKNRNISSCFERTSDRQLMSMYKSSNNRSPEEIEAIRVTMFKRGYRLQGMTFVK